MELDKNMNKMTRHLSANYTAAALQGGNLARAGSLKAQNLNHFSSLCMSSLRGAMLVFSVSFQTLSDNPKNI